MTLFNQIKSVQLAAILSTFLLALHLCLRLHACSSSVLSTQTMRAIVVSKFGGPEELVLTRDVPIPKPKSTEVLVRVKAAGVNPIDVQLRAGSDVIPISVPYIPGKDAAGIVEEVGADVVDFKVGDRVYCVKTTSGSYAEYSTAIPKLMGHLSDSLSFEKGAGLGVPYCTAYRALIQLAQAKAEETVLIHGASGAVGSASVQIAKSRGMRVLGTAGTEAGMKLVRENGADHVFNHREEGYTQQIVMAAGPGGIDVVLEMAASINLERDLELVRRGGRVVVVGSSGKVAFDPKTIMEKEIVVTGVSLRASEADWREMHAAIGAGMKAGWLRPLVGREFSLDEAADAHDLISSNNGAQGNIILKI